MSETNQKTVSYSQFSLYAKCPRRWELDYLQNRRVYEQSIHTIFGTAFHTTLQNYLTVMYNESVKKADEIDLPKYLLEQLFAHHGDLLLNRLPYNLFPLRPEMHGGYYPQSQSLCFGVCHRWPQQPLERLVFRSRRQ